MAISCWSVLLLHTAEATRWLINQRHSRREEGVRVKQRDGEDEGKHQRSAARVVEEEVAEMLVLRGRCCLGTKSGLTSLIMDRVQTN